MLSAGPMRIGQVYLDLVSTRAIDLTLWNPQSECSITKDINEWNIVTAELLKQVNHERQETASSLKYPIMFGSQKKSLIEKFESP